MGIEIRVVFFSDENPPDDKNGFSQFNKFCFYDLECSFLDNEKRIVDLTQSKVYDMDDASVFVIDYLNKSYYGLAGREKGHRLTDELKKHRESIKDDINMEKLKKVRELVNILSVSNINDDGKAMLTARLIRDRLDLLEAFDYQYISSPVFVSGTFSLFQWSALNTFSSIEDFLLFLLQCLLNSKWTVKLCCNCDKYFITKAAKTYYCSNIAPQERENKNNKRKTCREYMARKRDIEKRNTHEPTKLYYKIANKWSKQISRQTDYAKGEIARRWLDKFKDKRDDFVKEVKSGRETEKNLVKWLKEQEKIRLEDL